MPGYNNISKIINIIQEEYDLWLVYDVGPKSLSQNLTKIKTEISKNN